MLEHKIKITELNSQSKLIHIHIKDYPLSIASISLKAGSRFDPIEKEGLSHLLEHLMMKKTKFFTNYKNKITELEYNGIISNAFTSREIMYYYHIQEEKRLEKSLYFLIEGFYTSKIDKINLQKEKAIVLNESLENMNSPRAYIWRLANKNLWGGTKFGRDLFGNKTSINSITIKDIKKYRKSYYTPQNLKYIIISQKNTSEIKKIIEKYEEEYITISQKQEFLSKEPQDNNKNNLKILIEKRTNKQITTSFNIKTSDNLNLLTMLKLNLINQYLANTSISKLIINLRTKLNYTYWVDGETEYFSDRGLMSFIYSIDKNNLKHSIQIILTELKKLKDKEINKIDLNNIKNSYKTELIIDFLNPYNILWYYVSHANNTKIYSPQEYINAFEKISSDEILIIAKKYFTKDNISISLIGDYNKREELDNLLKNF